MNDHSTTKLSMTLRTSVYKALQVEAQQHRRELHEHIQRVLAEHVIAEDTIDSVDAERLKLMWSLVDRAVKRAKELCRNGEFGSDITLKTFKHCTEDPEWVDDYAKFVKDDIFKHGNPRKGPINREIGFRIRAGIGGTVVIGSDGKPAIIRVSGEVIQRYTPMESYNPEAVEV